MTIASPTYWSIFGDIFEDENDDDDDTGDNDDDADGGGDDDGDSGGDDGGGGGLTDDKSQTDGIASASCANWGISLHSHNCHHRHHHHYCHHCHHYHHRHHHHYQDQSIADQSFSKLLNKIIMTKYQTESLALISSAIWGIYLFQ